MTKFITRGAASILALLLFTTTSVAEERTHGAYSNSFQTTIGASGNIFTTDTLRKKKKKLVAFRAQGVATAWKSPKAKGNVLCSVPADYTFFLELEPRGKKAIGLFNGVAVKGPASAKKYKVKGVFRIADGLKRILTVAGTIRQNSMNLKIKEKVIIPGAGSCTFFTQAALVKQ